MSDSEFSGNILDNMMTQIGFTAKGFDKKYHFRPKRSDVFSNMEQTYENVVYYQIAIYPNPKTGKYHIRRFEIDGNNKVKSVKEKFITNEQQSKFKKVKKCNEYKAYPDINLNNVSYPSRYDIGLYRSNLLKQNTEYTGYANF